MNVKMTKYIIVDRDGRVLCKCLKASENNRNAFVEESNIGKRVSGYGNPLTFNHYSGAVKNLRQYKENGEKYDRMLSESAVNDMIEKGVVSIRRVILSFSDL